MKAELLKRWLGAVRFLNKYKLRLGAIFALMLLALFWLDFLDFNEKFRAFGLVRLSDTREDVLYRLGSPPAVGARWSRDPWEYYMVYYTDQKISSISTMMPKGTKFSDYDDWIYFENGGSTTISFDRKINKLISVACRNECPELYGISVGSTEDLVLARLGSPSSTTLKNGWKQLNYTELGVRFVLSRERVYGVVVFSEKGSIFAIAIRYLLATRPSYKQPCNRFGLSQCVR